MQEIELNLSSAKDPKKIEQIIESVCSEQGLKLVIKGSLQKYPGCTHWHYQKEKLKGTLEITYWPLQNRCWIPLREDRTKPWVLELVKILKVEIEKQVRS